MKKGSITVYLCLVLGVMISLFCAALFSARHAGARVVLASAAEQGMYSLFSRFDRTLFDTYGILALDGGYGSSELKLGALQKEAEKTVLFLTGASGDSSGPANLMHLSEEKGEVTGYTLLTDQNGAFMRKQIFRALTGKKAASAIQSVREKLSGYSADCRQLEQEAGSVDAAEIEKQYKNLQESQSAADLSSYRTGKEETPTAVFCTLEDSAGKQEETGEAIQTETENPVEFVQGLRKLGILQLVLPKDRTVSAGAIGSDRVSSRTLQQGMGIMRLEEADPGDKILLMEYLQEIFHDFTEAEEAVSGLNYQVEYAIAGKDTDAENLQAVLNRLLALREASNYFYLLKDPIRQEEVQAAALSLCTLVGFPAAEPIAAEMLRLCWAYGESVLDLRELLQGGKIPLMKDAESWQLSLNMMTHLQEEVTEQHSSENGLDYQWYLRLLLATKQEETLTEAIMDLAEHQIRQQEGHEDFRLDNCLVSMTISFRARQEKLFLLEAERNYHY